MVIGIIPARGGSKEIPRKNIKSIAGKPLITWTIEAAKKSLLLDQCIVSTENEEIAKISMEMGVEIVRRPPELATDEATMESVIEHVISLIPSDILVLLQPTSPIRTTGLIDECIKEFIEGDYDSLATGYFCKLIEYGKNDLRRQDIEGFFYDDGNVYVIKTSVMEKGDRYGKKRYCKTISRWENVEIDDEFDFWVAEKILTDFSINKIPKVK